ncbi:hypothetical protein FISHEDRAFT_68999 [Fistulina hepatica ATCC 64428]|uniref:Cupin 2 conserved barrel domain-containing protein n=1 Tax=Fistulina hepatica ATCC 64428 TaxID=1128425 RepID=A0A0D7ANR7_9AGAR|nr:hypothetical protein FISHEDRAFT_68999 [Fistulina hepatica ATCC 64428]
MSSKPYHLKDLRRVVTTHNKDGVSVVVRDTPLPASDMSEDSKDVTLWITTDGIPTADNNVDIDGAARLAELDPAMNLALVHPLGRSSVLRSTELCPLGVTSMHRTSSVDYNILIEGELILIMEDGTETHLVNPGDSVVQRGTLHAWRNPRPDRWTRWMSVVLAAHPAKNPRGDAYESQAFDLKTGEPIPIGKAKVAEVKPHL